MQYRLYPLGSLSVDDEAVTVSKPLRKTTIPLGRISHVTAMPLLNRLSVTTIDGKSAAFQFWRPKTTDAAQAAIEAAIRR